MCVFVHPAQCWGPKWLTLHNVKDGLYYTPQKDVTEQQEILMSSRVFLVMQGSVKTFPKTCPNLLTWVANIGCLNPLFQFAHQCCCSSELSYHIKGFIKFVSMLSLNIPVQEVPSTSGIHRESLFLENNLIDKVEPSFPLGTSLENLLLKT